MPALAGPSSHAAPNSPALTAQSSLSHLPPHLRPSHLLTRKDQSLSLSTYSNLLASSKAYTQALLALSTASTEFAHSLQECSRLKGAHKVGRELQAASGLEHLVGGHTKMLADWFWREFSIPLLEGFDDFRRSAAERQASHERNVLQKSKELKECEERHLRRGGRRKAGKDRDLQSFRRALCELQGLVDGLEEERASHYVEVLAAEEEEWDKVASRVSHLLRLQVEIHERLSSKPLSDPVLEPMLSAVPDPFGAYSHNGDSTAHNAGAAPGEIFSVLQGSSLLGGSGAPSVLGDGGPMASGAHQGMTDPADETLTPAGLSSPRAPSIGLPRAFTSGWSSPPTPPRPEDVVSSTSKQRQHVLGSPRLDGFNSPPGEISFAALGLTSATHPQASAGGLSSAGSIASPLFGSEDGSQDGDDSGRKRAGEEAEGEDEGRRADGGDGSDLTAGPSDATGGSLEADKGATGSTAGGAIPRIMTPSGSKNTGLGLGRRLKKALSIIDDETIQDEEEKRRRSFREATGDGED